MIIFSEGGIEVKEIDGPEPIGKEWAVSMGDATFYLVEKPELEFHSLQEMIWDYLSLRIDAHSEGGDEQEKAPE